jgi:hypothetical protein
MMQTLAALSADVVRELAIDQGVCIRPLLRRVLDRETDTETTVAIPCGSTREAVCPPCAEKARRLRMQQCAEGWHRVKEPEPTAKDHAVEPAAGVGPAGESDSGRRVRSTRRRDDAADLPRVPVEDRTVGRVFTAPDGREYRPSMFLTLTLPSYGAVRDGVPIDPDSYDYRRAALDSLHFPKLVDRFWQNLRRCAGYRVQYFAASNHSTGWPHTCTPRSVAPSRGRRCGRSLRGPTCRCGGLSSMCRSTSVGCRCGPVPATATRPLGRCYPAGARL